MRPPGSVVGNFTMSVLGKCAEEIWTRDSCPKNPTPAHTVSLRISVTSLPKTELNHSLETSLIEIGVVIFSPPTQYV